MERKEKKLEKNKAKVVNFVSSTAAAAFLFLRRFTGISLTGDSNKWEYNEF